MNDKLQERIPLFAHISSYNLTGSIKEDAMVCIWNLSEGKMWGQNGRCEFAEVAVVTKQNETTD